MSLDTHPRRAAGMLVLAAAASTLAFLALRLIAGTRLGLVFDEAYYWVWSEHLAASYYDHPPMVAYAIRLGTLLLGKTLLGVRIVSILMVSADALLVALIIWTLFRDRALAAITALLFNATLIGAGGVIIGPDHPLLFFWLLTLLGMARIATGGAAGWWLFVGAMAGCTLLSKYTGFFLGISIALWVLLVPGMRRDLAKPFVYLGGLIALAVFAPVLWWNAGHDWGSFAFQFGRVGSGAFRPLGPPTYVGTVFGIVTPFIFVLAVAGIVRAARNRDWYRDPRAALLLANAAPIGLYFLIHSLHADVNANWLGPVFAAFVLLAAYGWHVEGHGWWRKVLRFCRQVAIPFGTVIMLGFTLIVFIQVVPFSRARDPMFYTRGFDRLVASTEEIRRAEGAEYVLFPHYGLASEYMFYAPGVPVFLANDPNRLGYFRGAAPALAKARGLSFYRGDGAEPRLEDWYASVRPTPPIHAFDDDAGAIASTVADPKVELPFMKGP